MEWNGIGYSSKTTACYGYARYLKEGKKGKYSKVLSFMPRLGKNIDSYIKMILQI